MHTTHTRYTTALIRQALAEGIRTAAEFARWVRGRS